MVCQIGKILGLKVVAIAGSDDKCAWLENELKVDKAINYKSPNFVEEVKKHVGFLDVLFENVGGDILNLLLGRLNRNARIALCGQCHLSHCMQCQFTCLLGAISQYSA